MGQTLKPIAIVLTVVDYNMPDANLSWTDMQTQLGSDFNVAYYYLYKQTKFGQQWTRIAQIAGTTETYADTAVVDGGTYRYYVSAVITGIGECAESNVVELTMVTPGLTEIWIGAGVGGFLGKFAIDAGTQEVTAPSSIGVDYFYVSGDMTSDRALIGAWYENGFLHTTSFNARAYWWTRNLNAGAGFGTLAKIWNFTAGPWIPTSGMSSALKAYDIFTNGAGATRVFNATRDTLDSYVGADAYGSTAGTASNNTLGMTAADSSGRIYWASGGLYRRTVYPTPLNDGATLKATIQNGFYPKTAPVALYQDGAYAVVLQGDSSDATREGAWVHVIRASDGNMVSIDVNTTPNTYDNEHEPVHVSVHGNLAYVTRIDGDYQSGDSATRNLVYIIDLTNPDVPTLASTITTTTNGQTRVRRVVGYGDYIYFVMHRYYNPTPIFHTDTWFAYDISDPTNPVELAAQTLPIPVGTGTWDESWVFSVDDEAIDGGDKGQIVA